MKKYLFVYLFFFSSAILGAQGLVSSDDALEAPPSSIDLLKRSAEEALPAPASSSSLLVSPSAPAVKSSSNTTSAEKGHPALSGNKPAESEQPTKKVSAVSHSAPEKEAATSTEAAIEQNNALAKAARPASASVPAAKKKAPAASSASKTSVSPAAVPAREETSKLALAQEELDYAARMLEQARGEQASSRRLPPAASQNVSAPAAKTARVFNPNDYRPGVQWQKTNSTHFTIYTQKRDGGIGSANMSMAFETAYSTLRRNIPWMMSGKVRVFVYQDHNSYLKHEPNAKAWTRALAYPTRGEIVVYDEPGKQQELKEVFTHELVHIFTQQFFDKHNTGNLMTPSWLDEGLAVYMEDQAYNGLKGGPWNNDFKTLNFQRSKQSAPASFSSSSMFGSRAKKFSSSGTRRKGKPLYFMPFDQFMQENSLASMEGQDKTQDWYFQAYAMVRFLLNPAGGSSPSNRMQFEQFTRLMAQGEQVRDPSTGFAVHNKKGQPVYQPYSAEKAMGKAYRYNSSSNFEDAFWHWADSAR